MGILKADPIVHIAGEGGEEDRRHLLGEAGAHQVNGRRQPDIKHTGNVFKGAHQQERHLQRMEHFQRYDFRGRSGEGRANHSCRHHHPGDQQGILRPMRLIIHGELNIMMALHISPAVVAKPKARVPASGVAKNDLKKVANC